MPAIAIQSFVCEEVAPGLRVIRFTRPDLRQQLDPILGDDNVLYQDIMSALSDLGNRDRIVFNFGLVERFPTAFFQLLMRIRQHLVAKQGSAILCCFRDEIRNTVELMGGDRLFHLAKSEEAAIADARAM
jgi:anti-anti-sigma regulatory factor